MKLRFRILLSCIVCVLLALLIQTFLLSLIHISEPTRR